MKASFTDLLKEFWVRTKTAFTPRKPKRSDIFRSIIFIGLILLMIALSAFVISAAIVSSQRSDVFVTEYAPENGNADCILVFGALVRDDGTLSDMLRDRVTTGVRLYKAGAADKIIMSGDSEFDGYDETGAMKRYAMESGVPEKDIICDPYGLSTYDSIWRAKNVYGMKNVLLVTQEYHLYRALYISDKLGLDAIGCSADLDTYSGQLIRDIREIAARAKDFFLVQTGGTPKYTE